MVQVAPVDSVGLWRGMTPLVLDAEADALGAMNFLSRSLRAFRRPTFPVYAMRGCNASQLTGSSKCTTRFRASLHGSTRPESPFHRSPFMPV
jgi:hypothetical protein